MRRPTKQSRRSGAKTMVTSDGMPVAPPWKGWNAIQPLARMDPEHAIVLDDIFPQPNYVELRRGFAEHSDTETAAPVESLMAYHAAVTANDKLFGASADTIFNVTGSTASTAVGSLSSVRIQHLNVTTSGGHFLLCFTGADTPPYFDGTNWSTLTITGVDADAIVSGNVHKGRVWLIVDGEISPAYLPADAIQGAATVFDLSGVFRRGGMLMAMGTWTRDGGSGPDDLAVFVSSVGEVAIYSGTDPASADTWSLVGVFDVGSPIGRRCLTRVGADLALISIDGVIPVSQIPGMERGAAAKIALTANIQPVMNQWARDYQTNFGWQLISYPRGTRAILSVPAVENETQLLAVMNTVTGAWCRFRNHNANCMEIFRDRWYFGGNDGRVMLADTGGVDDGAPIAFEMKQAFNYFGKRGIEKRFTMIRPLMTTSANIRPGIGLNTDFRDDVQVTPGQAISLAPVLWDVAQWDVDEWPIEEIFKDDWLGVTGIGHCASLVMRGQVSGEGSNEAVLRLSGVDYLWENGSVL